MKSFQDVSERPLRLGLLVNPVAGAGGPLALKGSDDLPAALRERLQDLAQSGRAPAQQRVLDMLMHLAPGETGQDAGAAGCSAAGRATSPDVAPRALHWVTVAGAMGEQVLRQAGLACEVLPLSMAAPSVADDTRRAAQALHAAGVDLLLFAGGDGTARDVCAAIGVHVPVLGIPAGVKMHSGVFAINPQGAAAVLQLLRDGHWVGIEVAEVRDIDESGLQQGRVRARHYGEMRVPVAPRYLQQVKCSGREVEELVVAEIVADVVERLQPGVRYVLGPGTTTAAVLTALGLPATLMGVDVIADGALLAADATADTLLRLAEQGTMQVLLSPTGGQGSLIGRGNQQLSPALLRHVGRAGVQVLASHAKLDELAGRPLRLDTGDAALDAEWSGWWEIVTGYQQRVLYAVSG